MKKSKTITESHSGSKQSPAEEPDPVMEADEFVMVSTTDQPEIKEEKKATQISKESQIESKKPTDQTSTGSRKSVHWSPELVSESSATADHSVTMSVSNESSPYIAHDPAPESFSTSFREKMDTMKDVIGTWGRKVGEVTKRAEDLAEDTWQHFKTSPSLAEAAMGRIAQGTKVLAEGGYEKIFRQTFVTVPQEKLRNSFACYLSTSAGPVMGILYVSTSKLAFCSDTPLSYKNGTLTEWSYYKVIIPLHKLNSVNPSKSRLNSAEKYIRVISVDSHEFWFMGFFNYEGAATCLNEALQVLHSSQYSS